MSSLFCGWSTKLHHSQPAGNEATEHRVSSCQSLRHQGQCGPQKQRQPDLQEPCKESNYRAAASTDVPVCKTNIRCHLQTDQLGKDTLSGLISQKRETFSLSALKTNQNKVPLGVEKQEKGALPGGPDRRRQPFFQHQDWQPLKRTFMYSAQPTQPSLVTLGYSQRTSLLGTS